jgi:hypothetical protein
MPKFMNGIDVNGKNISGLADGTAATHAVTLQQLQAAVRGLSWKESVRAATTANINLSSALINAASVDGVTLATGDRVLVKAQTAGAENGIYTVVASGAASRTPDADSVDELEAAATMVEEGTTLGNTMWVMTTDNPTLGTTTLTWAQFGGGSTPYVAGAGLTESPASTFNVGAGTGITVNADDVAINTSVVARKFAANCVVTTNPQTFAHGLGTADLSVSVYEGGALRFPDISVDATNITVEWGGAPTAAQYRVVANG